jgi:hypothetical protein
MNHPSSKESYSLEFDAKNKSERFIALAVVAEMFLASSTFGVAQINIGGKK